MRLTNICLSNERLKDSIFAHLKLFTQFSMQTHLQIQTLRTWQIPVFKMAYKNGLNLVITKCLQQVSFSWVMVLV